MKLLLGGGSPIETVVRTYLVSFWNSTRVRKFGCFHQTRRGGSWEGPHYVLVHRLVASSTRSRILTLEIQPSWSRIFSDLGNTTWTSTSSLARLRRKKMLNREEQSQNKYHIEPDTQEACTYIAIAIFCSRGGGRGRTWGRRSWRWSCPCRQTKPMMKEFYSGNGTLKKTLSMFFLSSGLTSFVSKGLLSNSRQHQEVSRPDPERSLFMYF